MRKSNHIEKWAKDVNLKFTEKENLKANKHMK